MANVHISPTVGQRWVVVRGSDGNVWESHLASGAWTAWSNEIGQPPGGSNSAPAVAADPTYGLAVVILDHSNQIWLQRRYTGGSLSGWSPTGSLTSNSSPGVAISPVQTVSVFGLDTFGGIQVSPCAYGGCFSAWTPLGGTGTTGVTASGNPTSTYNSPQEAVVVLSTDQLSWIDSLLQFNWSGWSHVATQTTFTTDATPSITFLEITAAPYVTIHRTDGNYWVNGTNAAHP